MKVAIQGQLGSFHHEAAIKAYGTNIEIVPCATFRTVFEKVTQGHVEAGLVAIDNNPHGPINSTYRLLLEFNIWITVDVHLPTHQCLIASGQTDLATLQNTEGLQIRSQLPALEQVEHWLDTYLPSAIRETTTDTARSVAAVVHQQNPALVAVAGRYAAEMYGGFVVVENIEDDPDNSTRFVGFQAQATTTPDATDCSIIVRIDHTPGALMRALDLFNSHGINLIKLDSHPIPGDPQHYRFYVDFTARYDSPDVQSIFTDLKSQGCEVKILGCYKHIS